MSYVPNLESLPPYDPDKAWVPWHRDNFDAVIG